MQSRPKFTRKLTARALLQAIICFALMVSGGLSSLANAQTGHVSLTQFLCAPSVTTTVDAPTDDKQTAIAELLRAAGKPLPAQTPSPTPDNCDNCVTSIQGYAAAPVAHDKALIHYAADIAYIRYTSGAIIAPAGAPLGGRAPPKVV